MTEGNIFTLSTTGGIPILDGGTYPGQGAGVYLELARRGGCTYPGGEYLPWVGGTYPGQGDAYLGRQRSRANTCYAKGSMRERKRKRTFFF